MENPIQPEAESTPELSLDEIVQLMYSDLPEAPTGYYLDSNGLPVVTGDTKISIEGWGTEDYSAYNTDSDTQVALDADLLEAASATASFPGWMANHMPLCPSAFRFSILPTEATQKSSFPITWNFWGMPSPVTA